jgi:uncharacterized membrane protein
MSLKDSTPNSADAYLLRLRAALVGFPDSEVEEILREIRSYILERQEAAGTSDSRDLTKMLSELGSPEDIGELYRTEALVTRARSTFAPVLMFAAVVRLATKSVAVFASLMVALFGYLTGAAFLWCAVMKLVWPQRIGLWVSDHRFSMGDMVDRGVHSQELLGWWIIPIGLILGIAVIVATPPYCAGSCDLRYRLGRHAS